MSVLCKERIQPGQVRMIIAADLVWALASVAGLLTGWLSLSTTGAWTVSGRWLKQSP